MLTCKFHGWSYGLNGQLRFVPDEGRFFDLDKDRLGLTPVTLDIWEGFLFVHIDPHPRETLDEFLGEFGRQLRGYPFSLHVNLLSVRHSSQLQLESRPGRISGDLPRSGPPPANHRRHFFRTRESV